MSSAGRIALGCVGCVAYGLLLTRLKPLPQGVLAALPVVAYLLERFTASSVRALTFLGTSSLAVFCGYLYLFPEAFAGMTSLWADPTAGRAMPILPAVLGAIVGIGLFLLTFVAVLKPLAADEKLRRRGLLLLALIAVAAVSIDRLVVGI